MQIKCEYCEQPFERRRADVNKNTKRGCKNYCSKRCNNAARGGGLTMPCGRCGRRARKVRSKVISSKSGATYCSHDCANKTIARRFDAHHSFITGISSYRQRALDYYGRACTICGYDVEIVLEVHHRDANRRHNRIENLDVLCPTHHTEYQRGLRTYSRVV